MSLTGDVSFSGNGQGKLKVGRLEKEFNDKGELTGDVDARPMVNRVVMTTGGKVRLHANSTYNIANILVSGGIYRPSDYADLDWSVVLNGGTFDLGDGSAIGESGLTLSVADEGGRIMLTVDDAAFEQDPVLFPAGLGFSEGTDLTKLCGIVRSASGSQAAVYGIAADESGTGYRFVALPPTDEVVWIGGGSDNFWNTGANWLAGSAPTATQTAVFDSTVTVKINGTGVTVSNIVVKSGVTLTLQEKEWWSGSNLYLEKMEGEGKVVLKHVGLHANNATPGYTDVSVSEIEVQPMYRYVEPDWHRGDENDSWFESDTDKTFRFNTKFTGSGKLKFYKRAEFNGDNSGYTGNVIFDSVSAEGNSNRHFATPASLFSNANTFSFRGKMYLDFTEGTAKLGTVEFGESWGASFELKSGADVTLEVADGRIVDSYFGDGFEVNGGRLTVKKVGPGTLVYGVIKAHVLEVTEGRVEFTGEGDDSDVRVIVRAGASIGNAPAQTSGNGTKTGGAAVTVHHAFTFDEGAVVAQTISADEDGVLSVPVLTVAPAFDVTNVRFGFTNPELLPPVVRGTAYAKYPVADSPALTGAVRTVEDGIVPDGSARQCCWKAVPSGNTVIFRTYCPGFVVTVK